MEALGKIYLDTNIFIFAFESRNEIGGLIVDLLKADRKSRRFSTSELSLSELLVKPYKESNGEGIASYKTLIRTSEWLEVLNLTRSILELAAILRSGFAGLRLPDALHVSTAFTAGCSHILTADRGFKDVYDLQSITSVSSSMAGSLKVLRPDEPTLTSLLQSLAE